MGDGTGWPWALTLQIIAFLALLMVGLIVMLIVANAGTEYRRARSRRSSVPKSTSSLFERANRIVEHDRSA